MVDADTCAVQVSRSQAVCQWQVFAISSGGEEKLCAGAQGTIARLADKTDGPTT